MTVKRIGVLGTGNVGRTLAKGLIDLGYEVKLGSRDSANPKAVEWAAQSGPLASHGTFADAATFGDILVMATYGQGTEAAVKLAGPGNFAGKAVIDATNALDIVDGKLKGLFVGTTDSLAERIQKLAPEAKVVKAFNTTGWQNFINPKFAASKPDMFICGGDSEAKTWVSDLCGKWGWRAVDLGALDQARWIEPLVMIWLGYTKLSGSRIHALKIVAE